MTETTLAWNEWRRKITDRALEKPGDFFTLVVHNGDSFPHHRMLYTSELTEALKWAKEIWQIGLPEATTGISAIKLQQDAEEWDVPNPSCPAADPKICGAFVEKAFNLL